MTAPAIGDTLPDFKLPATGDQDIALSALRGKSVVLFFYPKASTPGCTKEGQQFRDLHAQFVAANAVVLGISRDGVKAQETFKAKQAFPYELLSDKDEQVCTLFDVIKMKNMYGKQVRGIERSTFLIDANGVLRQEWRKVKVDGHAQAVLDALAE
ncbi:MAG: peroxiredoxin [Gammaproteobacteria bacterium]|nr:peroxiredoxin [Gammaproteobacteria bacterium]MCP5135767.1 peroxiredoxin [Gammaproteobacteria bacterium]